MGGGGGKEEGREKEGRELNAKSAFFILDCQP